MAQAVRGDVSNVKADTVINDVTDYTKGQRNTIISSPSYNQAKAKQTAQQQADRKKN
jgi:hypothetical protein